VHGIDAHIPEGAVNAIMGSSGCGKSTIVKALNRTLGLTAGARVAGGTVSFRGQNLYAPAIDARAVRKAVGIIHQRPVPFPMSILENVLFGAAFHGQINGEDRSDYAKRYLDRVGLWSEVKDRLHEGAERLSGAAATLVPGAHAGDKAAGASSGRALLGARSRRDASHRGACAGSSRRLSGDHRHPQRGASAPRERLRAVPLRGKLVEAAPADQVFSAPRSALAQAFIPG
jgi:phosphate transport system ATP-binding protein